jgi:hypothetical protein
MVSKVKAIDDKIDYITNFGKWETKQGDGFVRPTIDGYIVCRSP